jgi:hypothetical protein
MSMILVTWTLKAQEYVGDAPISTDGPAGFYKIKLTSELTPWLNQDCSNVRIFDVKGKEIQFMMDEAQRILSSEFRSYPLISNSQVAGCCTNLTFENNSKQNLNHLMMRIRNAEVNKSGKLSGSDDLHRWYALKEDVVLSNINNGTATSEIRVLDFPLSDYKYYRLTIDDSASAPLNIMEVGYLENFVTNAGYTPIDDVSITFADSTSRKETYCFISFDSAQWVDQIKFTVLSPPFFKRSATLYDVVYEANRKGARKKVYHSLRSFELTSTAALVLDVKGSVAKDWLIVIDNQDNRPLDISSIVVEQLDRCLIAYLEGSPPYTLKVGKSLPPPVYDLTYFKEFIPESAPVVIPGAFKPTGSKKAPEEIKSFFSSRTWIWCGIIAIVVIMGWMSWSMIKETKARSDTQP